MEELMRDFTLNRLEAEGIVKALVENGIMTVSKVGAVIYHTGGNADT